MTKVKNLNGTSNRSPKSKGCYTWKEFWQKKKGRYFGICSCKGCSNFAYHGAHVQKVCKSDKRWYIVPLCISCNVGKKNKEFEVRNYDLVWIGNR